MAGLGAKRCKRWRQGDSEEGARAEEAIGYLAMVGLLGPMAAAMELETVHNLRAMDSGTDQIHPEMAARIDPSEVFRRSVNRSLNRATGLVLAMGLIQAAINKTAQAEMVA